MVKRYRLIVEGRVQGVGFRSFCQYNANMLGLSGKATNLENGTVEIFVQGEEENINLFLVRILKGNRFITIDDYVIKELQVDEKERSFKIGWGMY